MRIEDLKKLESKRFYFVEKKSEYELARMKGPCTVVLYTTGKVIFQGKEDVISDIKSELGLETKREPQNQAALYGIIVGSDETLKGDTFGGLVVAGFRADEEDRDELKKLGVRDSKTIDDSVILSLARKIRDSFQNSYYVIELEPLEYNKELVMNNITELLNRLHKKINEKLKIGNSLHIVDKYPGCGVGDVCEEKAESKHLEVAAASIIAREHAIKQINRLSEKAGFAIPKGSTHVGEALQALKKKNLKPEEFVKMDFSNVKKYLVN